MFSKRDKYLQRYFDGELGSRHVQKIEQLLKNNAEEQKKLDDLKELRTHMQEANAVALEEGRFDRLWSNVQLGIAQQEQPTWTEKVLIFMRHHGMALASALAISLLVLMLLKPFNETPANDCDIESLDVDPDAVTTIFTVDSSDKDSRNNSERDGKTMVIWVNDDLPQGDTD